MGMEFNEANFEKVPKKEEKPKSSTLKNFALGLGMVLAGSGIAKGVAPGGGNPEKPVDPTKNKEIKAETVEQTESNPYEFSAEDLIKKEYTAFVPVIHKDLSYKTNSKEVAGATVKTDNKEIMSALDENAFKMLSGKVKVFGDDTEYPATISLGTANELYAGSSVSEELNISFDEGYGPEDDNFKIKEVALEQE